MTLTRNLGRNAVTIVRQNIIGPVLCLIAVPASAQSSYVTATVGTDFSRFDHSVIDGRKNKPPDGVVLGGGVRLGTAFGERWGVETEFVSARMIETEQHGEDLQSVLSGIILPFGVFSGGIFGFGAGPPMYHVRVKRRNSTFSAMGWLDKQLNEDVDLVVLFGMGLNRTTIDADLSVTPAASASIRPNSAQATSYGFGPVAGAEMRIRAAQRWRFVPSMRLHKLQPFGGWLLRGTAGLSLSF